MSLLREVAANFGAFSNQMIADNVSASTVKAGSLGYGIQVVPSTQTAGSTVPFERDTTAFITLSNQNFNIQFNAADCYVGRVITGINKGLGAATFVEAVANTITFVDNGGFAVTTSTMPVVAYQGAYATFVCTEANGTTATLQTIMGDYGGSPILNVLPATVTIPITISTHTIISKSSGAATVLMIPLFLQDDGLPGRQISVTQVGGTTGSVQLAAAPGYTLTVYDLATGASSALSPVVTPGTTLNFIVTGGTLNSVILQQI